MSTCLLCLEDRKLIRSHIIPRAFFRLQDQKDVLAMVSVEQEWFPRRSPSGPYDERILCASCDQTLGILDQHAAETLLNAVPRKMHLTGFGDFGLYDGASAGKVFQFACSVAWRASKSRHPMFVNVDLGPYEDKIRHALLNDLDSTEGIECFLTEFEHGEVPTYSPRRQRLSGVNLLRISAERFTFFIKLDRRPLPSQLADFVLRALHPVRVLPRSWMQSDEFRQAHQAVRIGRKPSFWK
jgi:hypothetical protein